MDDLELDDEDGIITDDEVEIPAVEVRVPAAWQTKMSAKALRQAKPTEMPALLAELAAAVEARVVAGSADAAAVAGTDLPTFVWDRLSSQHGGNHKAVENSLSALINGVEASWQEHKGVQLFGELCGMLTADHSEVVSRRVLGLLAPSVTPPLVANGTELEGAIADALKAESADVPLDAATSALKLLRLAPGGLSELEAELSELAEDDDGNVSLAQLLLSCTLATRKHKSSAPADIVEEEEELKAAVAAQLAASAAKLAAEEAQPAEEEGAEGSGEDEEEEDEFENDDGDEEIEESSAPTPKKPPSKPAAEQRGAASNSASASVWPALASALVLGADLVASAKRESLFDQLDADADGQLSLSELETALPRILGEAAASATPPPRVAVPPSMPLLREAVSRAFEAAKNLGASVVVRDSTLSRDAFDRVVAYLHVTCVMLGLLGTKCDAAEAEEFDTASFEELVSQLPSEWGVDVGDATSAFEQLDEEQNGGGVKGDDCMHMLCMRAVPNLIIDAESPHSRMPGGGDRYGAVSDGGGSLPPPPAPPRGGLDPVFETTEKSAFSATGEWGNPSGSEGPSEGRGGGGSMNRSLGQDGNMSSVKIGFFDASKLGDLDDEASEEEDEAAESGGNLRQKYDRVKAELRELKAALREKQAMEEAHKQTVRKMLQANEALQNQLRDLNGVVERVVQRSLGGVLPVGAPAPRLPAGAFPAVAKPGSKAQRQTAGPPTAAAPARGKPRQLPPGERPFK